MTRREARELIMKMLYEMTFHPEKDANLLLEGYTQDMKGKVKDFIVNEFNGVLQHQEEIDSIIEASSTNWSINRIAKVDHMLLRMAVYEPANDTMAMCQFFQINAITHTIAMINPKIPNILIFSFRFLDKLMLPLTYKKLKN